MVRGVYVVFRRSLYQQLDKKLLTLAQSATPSFYAVRDRGSKYLNQVEEVPWRDIFNRDQQSLEWFDEKGNLLGRKGVDSAQCSSRIRHCILWKILETEEVFRTQYPFRC